MKKIIYLCFFFSVSMFGYGQIGGPGMINNISQYLCPNKDHQYFFTTSDHTDEQSFLVSISGGKILNTYSNTWTTSATFYLGSGGSTFYFDVMWDNAKSTYINVTGPTSDKKRVYVRSLSGTSTSVSVSSPYTISASGVLEIEKGNSGSVKLKALAKDPYNNSNPVQAYHWYINGTRISSVSPEYTFQYGSDDLEGMSIAVAGYDSYCSNVNCAECYDGPKTTIKIHRADPPTALYIINNHTTSTNFIASRRIGLCGSLSNNATINLIAGDNINIEPTSRIYWGTNVDIKIVPSLFRSASIEEEYDTIYTPVIDTTQLRSVNIEEENMGIINNINTKNSSQKGSWIGQNTPNPFNAEAVIEYYLPAESTTATIQVYDLTGRIVKSFSSLEKGSSKFTIQASELSKGYYTYSLIVDNVLIGTKKMLVK